MNRQRHAKITAISAAVALSCGLLLTPAAYAMIDIDEDLFSFSEDVEMSDDELGEMRGRFIGGNLITYFGVEMYTKVANASGHVTTAGLDFSTNIVSATDIRPTVTVFHSSTAAAEGVADSFSRSNSVASITSDGLNNIEGISQSIQVAGDLNIVRNELGIDISDDADYFDSSFDDMAEVSINFDGPETKSISDNSGTTTTFSLNKEGFGYTVVLPGDIKVTQSVHNAAQEQANGINQHVQITSNQYRVSNVINIVARQRESLNGLQRTEMGTALRSLRGLQSIGRL